MYCLRIINPEYILEGIGHFQENGVVTLHHNRGLKKKLTKSTVLH